MKILFIYKYEFDEPLGILHLSGFLKKHGYDCHFIDIKFEKNFIEGIQKISPEIIAYSITTGKHKFYQKLNHDLKKKLNLFSFFGGHHCTFFPYFFYYEGVDAICRGEGEFPFLELADGLEKAKDITKIKNLWIKVNGRVYKNELRDLIEDLDMLPFPDRELLNKYNHYKKKLRRFILAGRGCPYQCSYCFNHSYNKLYQNKGKIVRKRSVDNVIKELKFIKRTYQPRRFQFVDDIFILDEKWVLDLCDAYKKDIAVPFIACVRVNLVREEIVKALKEAGCITVVYAIESGNDYIRNSILQRDISKKQIRVASNIFNKYKIRTFVQNMVGLPEETLDMAFETMLLNVQCKATWSWVSIFQPYPQTELCKYSQEKGYFSGDADLFDESYYYRSIMKMKDMKRIVRLRHLFSLGVAFPFFIPLIKILIRLPLGWCYIFLWNMHRIWGYCFKAKVVDLPELFIRE